MIAASVAAANATLMAKPSGTNALATKSDATGCALCISRSDSGIKFVMGNAVADKDNYWNTLSAWATTALSTNSLLGDACCISATTPETGTDGTQTTFCGKGNVAFASDKLHSHLALAANDFYQSALAQCPHNTTNCGYAGKKADTTTAITIAPASQRIITVEDKGSVITLSMKGLIASGAGTPPAMTQKVGDVCTWIIQTKCDAPVITTGSTSAALSTTPEWSIQVLEWDEEFLTANTWLAAAYTGPGSTAATKFYPPLALDLTTSKIADLSADTAKLTTPNNLMGDISFKLPDKDGVVFMAVPGNTLVAWMANIKAVYASYSAEVTKYEAERVIWEKYAKYEAPAPGLFDWLFGPTVDADKPAAASSPLAPTQPVAVPTTVSSLALSVTDATKNPNPA